MGIYVVRSKVRFRFIYLLFCSILLTTVGCSSDAPDPEPVLDLPQTPNAPEASNGSESFPTSSSAKTILFFGNSLTAGYGLDPDQAFPHLIQQKIDSVGWDIEVVNAGLSGETSAGGLRRIDWLLNQKVDVLILELGGNDGLRGIPTTDTRKNLQSIIDRTLQTYPDAEIILAGMMIPPNLGAEYTEAFRTLYPDLAEANNTHLIPFLLEGVGGNPELNLPDGIHPTAEGHKIVAKNVWNILKPVLESIQSTS
jgi:acyl-CoA thioesterase-1